MKKSRRARKNDSGHALLMAVLRHVPFDGWTDEALDRAGDDCGIDAQDIFPRGPQDAIAAFSAWADEETLNKLGKPEKTKQRIRDKIADGVWTRLNILAPHREALGAALKHMAPPPRHLVLGRMVWQTADALWRHADDTATDYNHYTKRFLLSGVITTTTLFWLKDSSEGFSETRDFLDRRIDNVLTAGRTLSRLKPGARKKAS
ncbi:MAG: COQ9 family protein [Alphaproteobacteria bacterium]|nr:COQ9 family protein [Alphaproteobacteria bacterium]